MQTTRPFILEEAIDQVRDPATKEYLKEVLSSYHNGNYRSAIVVLYSIIIFDIIQKLLVLKDIYNDQAASEIITEMEQDQKKAPNSPEWEKKLLENVKNRTELLSIVDFERIDSIKKNRNLSAHPVHNHDYKLVNITKETTRALIRDAFEIVFLKDALLGSKIVDVFLNDLNNHYSRVGVRGLQNHLTNRYFKRMTQNIKDSLFKSLWKIAFILDDDECNRNREANHWGIRYLIETNLSYYKDYIRNNQEKLGRFHISENITVDDRNYNNCSNRMGSVIIFLMTYDLYPSLSDDAKNIIKNEINRNIYLQINAVFLHDDLASYFKWLLETIKKRITDPDTGYISVEMYPILENINIDLLYEKSHQQFNESIFFEFMIEYFSKAPSFYSVDTIWEHIKRFSNKFSKSQFDTLFERLNGNGQFFNNRNKNTMLNYLISSYSNDDNQPLGISQYPNLSKNHIARVQIFQ